MSLVGGRLERTVVRAWTRHAGDGSKEWDRFQAGGIWELLRTPDAAARYAAKEAGKRAQKALPPGWNTLGRWWGGYRLPKPKPGKRVNLTGTQIQAMFPKWKGERVLFGGGAKLKHSWSAGPDPTGAASPARSKRAESLPCIPEGHELRGHTHPTSK